MINFFSTIFNSKAMPAYICGDYNNPNNVIQECESCDSTCQSSSEGSNDEGGNGGYPHCDICQDSCLMGCLGTCVSLASLAAGK